MIKRAGFTALLFLVCLNAPHGAFAEAGGKESWINLNLYSPCEVKIDYEYTGNVSVSDVTAYGPSLYEVTTSPIQLRFEAQDVDEYLFNVKLRYDVVMVQTIRITWFSGENQPPSSMDVPVAAQEMVFHFSVTTSNEPHYPSTSEITEHVMRQVNERLGLYHQDNLEMQDIMKEGINSNTLLSAGIGALVLIFGVAFFKFIKGGERG